MSTCILKGNVFKYGDGLRFKIFINQFCRHTKENSKKNSHVNMMKLDHYKVNSCERHLKLRKKEKSHKIKLDEKRLIQEHIRVAR